MGEPYAPQKQTHQYSLRFRSYTLSRLLVWFYRGGLGLVLGLALHESNIFIFST